MSREPGDLPKGKLRIPSGNEVMSNERKHLTFPLLTSLFSNSSQFLVGGAN
jgi:hypothetical protein